MKKVLVALIVLFIANTAFAGYLDIQKKEKKRLLEAREYYPNPTEKINTYYLHGMPFGEYKGDSIYMLLYLTVDNIGENSFFKLWVLYMSSASGSFVFEPMKSFKLVVEADNKTYNNISPVSPIQILKLIDEEKESQMILTMIGGALKTFVAAATPQATISGPTGEYTVHNKSASSAAIGETKNDIEKSNAMYDAFKNSANVGILRKNTLFQDKGITGNVYFDIHAINLEKCNKILLSVNTLEGIKYIEFTPKEGE